MIKMNLVIILLGRLLSRNKGASKFNMVINVTKSIRRRQHGGRPIKARLGVGLVS